MLITTHRLPAPISEVETPTPAPEQPAKPTLKLKPKVTQKNSEDSAKLKTPSPTAKPQSIPKTNAPFAGTWSGTLSWGIFGNFQHTIVIDAAQKTVSVTNVESGTTFPASIGGDTISWATGYFNEHKWTLKPLQDGKTALVSVGGHNSVVFRREN